MRILHTKTSSLFTVILGVVLANFLFWEEKFGLNCFLFSVFWLGFLVWHFPNSLKNKGFWATAGGTVLSALMILWHNSGAAKTGFLLSMGSAAGFAQADDLRFLGHAFLQYILNWTSVPIKISGYFTGQGVIPTDKRRKGIAKWLQLGIFPLVIVGIFYMLYYWANDKFASISDRFWSKIGQMLSFDISFDHLLFLGSLLIIVGAAFWKTQSFFRQNELNSPDFLLRKSREAGQPISIPRYYFSFLGLRKEYHQSLLTLGLLNLLLFVVNVTDVAYVWTGLDEAVVNDLKHYVHEGTYVLITSILLAMGVLFHVFRGNLNFYPKPKYLKILSLVWLIQNGILALSVGIINRHYIDYHGLAYKRIGVFLFLMLTLFGLFSLWFKIRDRHTSIWLWRQNSWAFYGLMLINALVPWDQFITQYNITTPVRSVIDVHWLIYNVSYKNIHILEDNKELLKQKACYPFIEPNQIDAGLKGKRANFDEENALFSWKSWNFADAQCQKQ